MSAIVSPEALSPGMLPVGLQVGIDLLPLRPPLTGIGNYQLYLLMALLAHAGRPSLKGLGRRGWIDVDFPFLRQVSMRAAASCGYSSASVLDRLVQLGRRSVVLRSAFSAVRRRIFESHPKELSLFHAFAYLPPSSSVIPAIPVVYDLSFIRFPETHPPARLHFLKGLDMHLQRAPVVHTISQFSAAEISDVFGIPRSRIAVIYPGVKPVFASGPTGEPMGSLAPFDIQPASYFLTVSTLEPRKNLCTLVDAYSQLSAKLRQKIPLCIAGAAGWGGLNLPKSSQALEREGSLRFLGYVSDSSLRDLYGYSRAMFYPSLYEGFGMPVTEALACGARVICSNTASLPEAGGTLVRYVDPFDVDGWLREMQIAAETVDAVADQIAARKAFSRQFTWAAAADRTLDLYWRATK